MLPSEAMQLAASTVALLCPTARAQEGGHVSTHASASSCTPVRCDTYSHEFHGEGSASLASMMEGCRNVTMYNFMTNESEHVMMTCEGCVPHLCSSTDHDCVPVYCLDGEGELHGGHHDDPCTPGHHSDDGLAWWPFLLVCMGVSLLVTTLLKAMGHGACCGKSFNPPFTVIMFLFGYLISSLAEKQTKDDSLLMGSIENVHTAQTFSDLVINSVLSWKEAHPHVILFVLLPPLLFEDAASMDYYVFRKVLMSSVILAGPGVLFTMLLCAATTMALFGFANECVIETDHTTGVRAVRIQEDQVSSYPECEINHGEGGNNGLTPDHCQRCIAGQSPTSDQLPVSVHLLLGGMLAATDPVAVCAVLNDLGCPNKLNYLIAGESLLNDGTAVVAFLVMQSVAGGCNTDAAAILVTLCRLAGGGVLFGLFMAALAYQSIKYVDDPNVEITMLILCSLSTFWLAENVLHVSGVLGTVIYGIQTARTSFLAMNEHSRHANHAVWSEIGYVATCIIFILAGVKSQDKISRFVNEVALNEEADADDAASAAVESEFEMDHVVIKAFALWVVLGIIRAFVVWIFSPLLTKMGYGLTKKEAVVMVWGGLRGAVSLSLALLVDGNHMISPHGREMIFMMTVGIVTLTLLINGTTAGMVYKVLGVYPENPFESILQTQGLRQLQVSIEEYATSLENHWFHRNADVKTIKNILPDFSKSHIFDGDLVDFTVKHMDTAWKEKMMEGAAPSPVTLSKKMAEGIKSGTVAGFHILRAAQGYHKHDGDNAKVEPKSGEAHVSGGGGDGHGHGHSGGSTTLVNAKRWIEEAQDNEVDSAHALYGILVKTLLNGFNHALEKEDISPEAFVRLSAACGLARDVNTSNLEGAIIAENPALIESAEDAKVLQAAVESEKDLWQTPIDYMVNSVIEYTKRMDGKLKNLMQTPSNFFGHQLLCGEMLMELIQALDSLADAGLSELGVEFATNVQDCIGRLKVRLATMQAASPNCFRAAHTIIAYKRVSTQWCNTVDEYTAQGFFESSLVEKLNKITLMRERELAQYINIDTMWLLLGWPTKFVFMADHPVVFAYYKDQEETSTTTDVGKAAANIEMETRESDVMDNPLKSNYGDVDAGDDT